MADSHSRPVSAARRRRRRVGIALLSGLVVGAAGGIAVATVSDLPAIRELESYEPTASTRIFDRNGLLIAEVGIERRIPVPVDQIPPQLLQAIVAVEDESFYEHHGVDIMGILRAVVSNVLKGRAAQGGSTITQQLAKNLFLTPEKTLQRKLKEAYLAFQIEQRYTKKQILEIYLNQIYLGSGAFGVEAASQIYFGKSAKDLDLLECALIAGLPKAPATYDPLKNPDKAKERRNVVLLRMRDAGVISGSEYERLKEKPVTLSPTGRSGSKAPYFVEYILPQLEQRFGGTTVWRGGLRVYTTLDLPLQEAANDALEHGVAHLRKRQRGNPTYPDIIEGAFLALEPNSGDILAMVGGSDFAKTQFNRAVQAQRQPGSTFKPIVYAAAVQAGYSQADPLWDTPIHYRNAATGKVWEPKNWYRDFLGKIPMRIAMEHSSNCASIYLLERIGLPAAIQTARRLGITTPLASNLTLALGSSDVTVLDLTRAYAAFANGGVSTESRAIVRVLDRNDRLLWEAPPAAGTVALTPESAYVITDILHGYTTTGGGRRAGALLEHQVAGKTGTTDSAYDAWFVGFNTNIVATVWLGIDSHKPMPRSISGASGPLPIWIDFMKVAEHRRPPKDFEKPARVTLVDVDRGSGRRLAEGCVGAEPDTWAFIEGTEPTESCADIATSRLPFDLDLGDLPSSLWPETH